MVTNLDSATFENFVHAPNPVSYSVFYNWQTIIDIIEKMKYGFVNSNYSTVKYLVRSPGKFSSFVLSNKKNIMKKVTVLTMLLFGIASNIFAQTPETTKLKAAGNKEPNAILVPILVPGAQKINSAPKPSPQVKGIKLSNGKTPQPTPLLLPAVQTTREAAARTSTRN